MLHCFSVALSTRESHTYNTSCRFSVDPRKRILL